MASLHQFPFNNPKHKLLRTLKEGLLLSKPFFNKTNSFPIIRQSSRRFSLKCSSSSALSNPPSPLLEADQQPRAVEYVIKQEQPESVDQLPRAAKYIIQNGKPESDQQPQAAEYVIKQEKLKAHQQLQAAEHINKQEQPEADQQLQAANKHVIKQQLPEAHQQLQAAEYVVDKEEGEQKIIEYMEDQRELREIWKLIQGCDDWEGLLDPMNSHLRREIIRYGEFAQACYDSFDFDPHSKYCGTCKYTAAHFFERLGMANCGYTMSRYLYATSNINLPNFFQMSSTSSIWSQHANWMGYVAVATNEEEIHRLGRRDIVIAWRGTVTYLEWIHDLKNILHPAHFRDDPDIKIESGFFDLYTKKEKTCNYCTYSAREQVLSEVNRLIEMYKDEELSITVMGHSLGASLALLSAYDIAEMKVNIWHDENSVKRIPVTVFSFAGPRVGNLRFKERCNELELKVLRVVNVHDKVPTVPGIIANENFQYQKELEKALQFPWSYAHVGVELSLDHTNSPFLKNSGDLGCAHNLEAHLHLVDGYHGKGQPFRSATGRDIALVNKDSNFLKRELGVPPHWRQDENKGMVRTSDGRWVLPERPRFDAHPPDTGHHFEKVLSLARARLHLFEFGRE